MFGFLTHYVLVSVVGIFRVTSLGNMEIGNLWSSCLADKLSCFWNYGYCMHINASLRSYCMQHCRFFVKGLFTNWCTIELS